MFKFDMLRRLQTHQGLRESAEKFLLIHRGDCDLVKSRLQDVSIVLFCIMQEGLREHTVRDWMQCDRNPESVTLRYSYFVMYGVPDLQIWR